MRMKIAVGLIVSFLCALSPVFAQMLPEVATYEQLVQAIRQTRVFSQQRIEAAVEQEKVREAWETGKLIDTHVLQHKDRAQYGEQVIKKLADDLETSDTELHYMLQFARAYPIDPPGGQLSWSHYRVLLAVNDSDERKKVTEQAIREHWNRDQVRAEVRRRKSRSEPANENQIKLPEVKPGKTGVYRVIALPALSSGTPHSSSPNAFNRGSKHLKIDLGFNIYHDLPEASAGKFKAGDIFSTDGTQTTGSEYLYTYKAKVTEVYDGDTFHALIDLGFGVTLEQRLRLRRLDAPEILSAEGKEAKALLEKTLTPEIIIKVSKSDDQYGRYLVDVFTSDLVSIDAKLLDSGIFTLREDES